MKISLNNQKIHELAIPSSPKDSESFFEPITEPITEAINIGIDNFQADLKELFLNIGEVIRDGVMNLMHELVDLILTTPTVSDNPVIVKIWVVMRAISYSLIALMFIWQGFMNVVSSSNIGRTVDFKDMFTRMIYALILSTISLNIIDVVIHFNNALIDTLKSNFSIAIDSKLDKTTAWNYFITMCLLIVQVVLSIRIAIQYFMRLGEIWVMSILSPVVYTLWIMPGFGGYLKSWLSRIISVIFTTFFWALILVIYTAMVSLVSLNGTIWGMCMSIALLLFMLKTPSYFNQFLHAQENPLQILNGMKTNVLQRYKVAKGVKSRITNKVRGFIK